MFGNLGLSFLAGALSILSPCVLPLLPIVLGTAASQGKYSPVVLGFGVVLSFVSVGLFVALVGFSIGLDGGFFRSIAAAVLVLIGVVLLVPNFQSWFALVAAPMSGWRNIISIALHQPELLGNLASAFYWVQSGAPASGRHWEQHRCWPPKEKISVRLQRRWLLLELVWAFHWFSLA